MLHTRPDLTYCVGILSRYMHEPNTSHTAVLKQVLRYLKGTLSLGLVVKRVDKSELVGYSDSSHNIDEDNGRSTTDHMFYLNDCPIYILVLSKTRNNGSFFMWGRVYDCY